MAYVIFQGKGNQKRPATESVNGSPLPVPSLKDVDAVKVTSGSSIPSDSPQTGQRSVSSSSNSPNSVRVNQEYVAKMKARTTSNGELGVEEDDEEAKEATNSEDDIDMLDAKTPLLKEKNSTVIVESAGNGGGSN